MKPMTPSKSKTRQEPKTKLPVLTGRMLLARAAIAAASVLSLKRLSLDEIIGEDIARILSCGYRLGLGLVALSPLALVGQVALAGQAADSVSIVHRGFGDLRRGALGDSGANLYVSARGRIQTIHRWDLNRDGELDLFFTQDHNQDYAPDAMIYWGGAGGHESLSLELPELRTSYSLYKHADQARLRMTWLPALGGGRCQVADLNGDGYPDIVFGNTMHNYRQDMPAYVYWGSPQGFRENDRTVLPGYTVTGVAIGDLNEDGLPDIVLANAGFERGMEERFGKMSNYLESYIYWGDTSGFPRAQIFDVARRTALPTVCAADVAIGDFNGDRHLDIAFANNHREERSIYIYWGDGTGNFAESKRQVLRYADQGTPATKGEIEIKTLLAADLNNDGIADLVAAGNRNAMIFNGSRGGLVGDRAKDLPAANCLGLEAADLNGDGQVDLILANAGEPDQEPPASTIYWGAGKGFSSDRRTDLPTLGAKTVKAADLNKDGSTDLLFGNENDMKRAQSQIFWGGANGFSGNRRKELQSFGVVGAGIADFNRDGNPDIVLVNRLHGDPGIIPSAIYWGNQDHSYSSASVSLLKPGGEMMFSIADLDDDDFPDIVMMHGGKPYIWWGSPSGYSADNRTAVPLKSQQTAAGGNVIYFNVADLDADGHLDIVCGIMGDVTIASGTLSASERRMARAVIVYGNDQRFKDARLSGDLQLSGYMGSQSLAIADLNKDGYLELIFPMSDIDLSEIWWGGANGYDARNVTKIEANGAPCAVAADLDGDGWLDLVFTSSSGKRKEGQPVRGSLGVLGRTQNTETYVYWGSAEGFKKRNELESFVTLDATVGDFNRDGNLDIALTNYKSDTTRDLPAIIYWGDGARGFSNTRRTFLDASSSSAIDALDLNRDGWLDLVISNHQKNFSHASGTYIYWGGEKGYSIANRTTIPTIGVHLDAMVDAGNVYDRKYEWDYVSPAVECSEDAVFGRLQWKAATELGTAVKFQVRSAAAKQDLAKARWSGPKGEDSFYQESGADLAAGVKREHRWLQYRAVLSSPDGGNSPILTEVEVVCLAEGRHEI